ncbi:MAG: hypothetical protein ACT6Q5_00960 [Sphingopyxis solisilvae]|uniref:hypothetical protein n=1 Tax=Sphingopyxis solisilvae TaxID=1886788 RepID=UPI0040355737
MTGRLFRDGFTIERFYSSDVGEFYDEIGSMLHFALPNHSDDLADYDCKHQLLSGVDGRFIRLFGSLHRVRGKLDNLGYEQISLEICKAFYLLKREDYDGYATTINGLDGVLRASVLRKKTANDHAQN